jgi:hypothetical protein
MMPENWSMWMMGACSHLGYRREPGLPVMIHVADPVAFFDPVDATTNAGRN